MRRSPMSRSSRPMKKTRLKPKKRSASEFARIYGSRERVEWIKGFACFAAEFVDEPCEGEIQNAHTANGGMGRKAGYATIIPLCHEHHAAYDQWRWPFHTATARAEAALAAAETEKLWQSHHQRSEDDAA